MKNSRLKFLTRNKIWLIGLKKGVNPKKPLTSNDPPPSGWETLIPMIIVRPCLDLHPRISSYALNGRKGSLLEKIN